MSGHLEISMVVMPTLPAKKFFSPLLPMPRLKTKTGIHEDINLRNRQFSYF